MNEWINGIHNCMECNFQKRRILSSSSSALSSGNKTSLVTIANSNNTGNIMEKKDALKSFNGFYTLSQSVSMNYK